jgi:hypothetical protein
MQNETLAVVTKAGMAVAAECIVRAFDAKSGVIEWEGPSASAASSSSAGGAPLQPPARNVFFSENVEHIEPVSENVDVDMDLQSYQYLIRIENWLPFPSLLGSGPVGV